MKHPNLRSLSSLLTVIGLVSLAACSNPPVKEREARERARFEAYAGPAVDHVTYLGRYDGWKALSASELAIWTNPFEAFLIKVGQPCDDLTFVNGIRITQSTARTINTRLDFVEFRQWSCAIEEIRPVDYRRMKADLRNGHAAASTQAAN